MKSTKVKAGMYVVEHHGFAFTASEAEQDWVLWNEGGTEVFRCDTKGGLIQALGSYDEEGAEALHNQEFCNY